MHHRRYFLIPHLMAFLLIMAAVPSGANILVRCPGDTDGDAVIDTVDPAHPNAKCMHLGAGDGYAVMADGKLQYIFSFSDLTGIPTRTKKQKADLMNAGMLAATWPAPTIMLDEGDEFYLNLTNVGMMMRPDLFDACTVHWHGFPQASSIFDGVPDASISINMGATLTYYYKVVEPGTYMYHCQVEATEHMQMGMLGNLYVRPAQDGTPITYQGKTYTKFAYNDGDGSTGYDVNYPIQIGGFDSNFHDASATVQPLPFAAMKDNYPMLNGRGYPDTVNPLPLTPPAENGGKESQKVSSLIEAAPGDRILLRISSLDVTRFYTLASLGISMKVVGSNARLLRGSSPDGGITPGKNLYYTTNSVTLGGGETADVILEVPDTAPSGTTYFLYSANLNYLSNHNEDFGGMMTEIRIN
ncbi:MAG: multicopper oxidase domain-containing protein [bacterium]